MCSADVAVTRAAVFDRAVIYDGREFFVSDHLPLLVHCHVPC